jgi:hypothetical protein
MASILVLGSFLAGSLLTILLPIGLLIAIAVWHTRAIMRVPSDPGQTAAVHAAGPAEAEGQANAGDAAAPSPRG